MHGLVKTAGLITLFCTGRRPYERKGRSLSREHLLVTCTAYYNVLNSQVVSTKCDGCLQPAKRSQNKKREVITNPPTRVCAPVFVYTCLRHFVCVCARVVKRKLVCGYDCANFMFLNNVHLNNQNTKPSILYNSDIQSHIYVQTIHFTVF